MDLIRGDVIAERFRDCHPEGELVDLSIEGVPMVMADNRLPFRGVCRGCLSLGVRRRG